jgi:CheY-like chemotaxis protein
VRLGDDGCEVLAVSSTADAIAQAGQFCPDTLIIETMIPGIDGLQAAKRIAQDTKCMILFLEGADPEFWNARRRAIPDCDILPMPLGLADQDREAPRRQIASPFLTEFAQPSIGTLAHLPRQVLK